MAMCKGCNEVFSSVYMKNGYCEECLQRLNNDKQIIECKKCKTINKNTSNFCKYCGEKLEKNIVENNSIQEKEDKTLNKEVSIKEEKSVSEPKSDKKVLDENSKFSGKKENKDSNADELLKWAELLEKGLIDKDDFEKKKRELI
jgi:hypothetical protein